MQFQVIIKKIIIINLKFNTDKYCLGFCIFLAVAIFGGNAYRRDWLMYPKFNVLSWSYSLAVVACFILLFAALILRKEANKSYEIRSEAKNLVMQMEMQTPGYHSSRSHSRSLAGAGYI